MGTVLSVKNLKKEYPKFTLDNISFEIEEGMIMGLIGRNGAGKTTTIKSILNLIHTSGGDIAYFGKNLAQHEAEIKQQIGYAGGAVDYYKKRKSKKSSTSPNNSIPAGTKRNTAGIWSCLNWMKKRPLPNCRKA